MHASRHKRGGFCYAMIAPGIMKFQTDHFIRGNIDKRFYMDTLQLEESEYNLIRYPQRGVCLYKCGSERYSLVVHAPEYKTKLFWKGRWLKNCKLPIDSPIMVYSILKVSSKKRTRVRDVSPHETQNPEEWVTEVCYPVKKK